MIYLVYTINCLEDINNLRLRNIDLVTSKEVANYEKFELKESTKLQFEH